MALFFLIAFALISQVFSSQQEQIKANGLEGKAFHFMEHFLRKLSKDEDFQLPSSFRQADGQLMPQSFNVSSVISSPKPCESGSKVVNFTSNGATLSYNYAPSDFTSLPTQFCVYFSGDLAAVDVNYDKITKKATDKSIDVLFGSQKVGLSCVNCWAYIGANLGFQASCSTTSCTIAFVTGGTTGLNFDLELKNPNWGQAYSNPNILSSSVKPVTLFYDPTTGISINAQPKLAVAVGGAINATGSSSVQTTLVTNASLVIGLDGTNFGITPQGAISAKLPTITSTSFTVDNTKALDMSMSFSPTVEWSIGFGCDNPGKTPSSTSPECIFIPSLTGTCGSYSGLGLQVVVDTPITTTVNFKQDVNSKCTNSIGLSTLAALTKLNAIFDFICCECTGCTPGLSCTSYNLLSSGGYTTDSIPLGQPTPGTQCISASSLPVGSPSQVPSSQPGGSSSSSSSSSLTDGQIAAAVVVPVVAVGIGGAAAGYYYYHKSSSSDDIYKPLHKENA